MVVAVVVVLVVEVRPDEVVVVIGMRDSLMAAVGAMTMFRHMIYAYVFSASRRLRRACQGVLVDVIAVRTVQVAIV